MCCIYHSGAATLSIGDVVEEKPTKNRGKQILQLFDFGANYHKRFQTAGE